MTQEEKILLMNDICARMPHDVLVGFRDSKIVCSIISYNNLTGQLYTKELNNNSNTRIEHGYPIYDYLPYLRPISSMTDEEKREYNYTKTLSIQDYPTIRTYDWLNSHHFDCRNLIGKGLAIEVTQENNPYKK